MPKDDGDGRVVKWGQEFFFADFGECVVDELSPASDDRIKELDHHAYYTGVGNDGQGLRVPDDLDDSICCYMKLPPEKRDKFDRACFWMDMASRQWTVSFSASFASLVIAIEALADPKLRPTERFRDFLEVYAGGAGLKKRRNEMYDLRSEIIHGSGLMEIDRDAYFGWSPPERNDTDMTRELWELTQIAIINWLRGIRQHPSPVGKVAGRGIVALLKRAWKSIVTRWNDFHGAREKTGRR